MRLTGAVEEQPHPIGRREAPTYRPASAARAASNEDLLNNQNGLTKYPVNMECAARVG